MEDLSKVECRRDQPELEFSNRLLQDRAGIQDEVPLSVLL